MIGIKVISSFSSNENNPINCVFLIKGMVKQPVSETSAFTMSSEDFPALPGTAPTGAGGASNDPGAQVQAPNASQPIDPSSSEPRINNQTVDSLQKRGIVTSPDGNIHNNYKIEL